MSHLFQGRNNKFSYYLSGHLKRLYPKFLLKLDLDALQKTIKSFDEKAMYKRLNYYNKLNTPFSLEKDIECIRDISGRHGVYSLDLMEYTRYFPQEYKLSYVFGNVTNTPNVPSMVKSRPIIDNHNAILMKMNKVRHFYFVNDQTQFKDKRDQLVWRGAAHQQHRIDFLQKFYNHSKLLDVGSYSKQHDKDAKWQASFMSIQDQLKFKFVLSIEGNDVATSTKWTMSSNSLCFMTKPKYETWFMEGELVPNYHYVLIKDDYSDLEQKVNYYIEHAQEAEEIISNANQYVQQFKDNKSEDWLNLKVLEKYFDLSGQSQQ